MSTKARSRDLGLGVKRRGRLWYWPKRNAPLLGAQQILGLGPGPSVPFVPLALGIIKTEVRNTDNWAWQCRPSNPALRRQKEAEDLNFKAFLGYTMSTRPV